MPTVVAAIGFLALFGPRGVTGLELRGTLLLVLLAHVFYNYAVVVRIVGAYLEALGPRLPEVAQLLGSSPWRVLRRVTLPLAAPAILAAAALVFIFCFTSFGVIMILAPGPAYATLEVEIYALTSRLRLEGAAVLVLAQLLVISLFTFLYTRLQRRLAVTLGGGGRPLPRPTGGVAPPAGRQLRGGRRTHPLAAAGAPLRDLLVWRRAAAQPRRVYLPRRDRQRAHPPLRGRRRGGL
jgi:thiamine transport system permease protein